MGKIGIYFGTDTGTTRLIAKKIVDAAAKPVNVNRITPDELLAFDALILGTPSYGEGRLPGKSAGNQVESWEEFLPQLEQADFSGKIIALYGLGNQEKYGEQFSNSLGHLYRFFKGHGATIVGDWPTDGYDFAHSESVVGGRLVGLVIDQSSQAMLTEARLDAWVTRIVPHLGA